MASLGTFILPVAGSTVTPVRPPSLAIVISTLVGVAGEPLTRSLSSTSTTPPLATVVSGSSLALIVGVASGVTVIFTLAVSQGAISPLTQIL